MSSSAGAGLAGRLLPSVMSNEVLPKSQSYSLAETKGAPYEAWMNLSGSSNPGRGASDAGKLSKKVPCSKVGMPMELTKGM